MNNKEVKQAGQDKRERDFTAEFWRMVDQYYEGDIWYGAECE